MRKKTMRLLTGLMMLFYFSAFLLISLRNGTVDYRGLMLAAAVPAMIWAGTAAIPRIFRLDSLLMAIVHFLCALGVLILYSTQPSRGLGQAVNYAAGMCGMLGAVLVMRSVRKWGGLIRVLMILSVGLLVLPLVFGRETNGATNWVYIGGLSIQPSELVKLSLILVLAWEMSRGKLLKWAAFALACLAVLMVQKDLGTALLYYGTALIMYYAASGNVLLTLAGIGGGCGAAVMGYTMFAHVKKRVAIWLNPWSDYENAGYQIVQSLMAIASGGLFGVGLGLGSPKTIPVYYTDFIFAVICEQFGVLFGLIVILMYLLLVWRGIRIASDAGRGFTGLVALGCTCMLGLQTFVIIGGVIKLIPLTGVTLPFVSYGGSSMVSSMCTVGLLEGVASNNEREVREDEKLAGWGK